MRAGVQPVRVSLPYCIGPGEVAPLTITGLPDDYPLELSATFGRLDPETLEYRAPLDHPEDELHATVYDAFDGTFGETKDLVFARIRFDQTCSFRLTSADGYSLTIDPRTNTTLAKDPSGRAVAYFDRKFVYANDESLGIVRRNKANTVFGATITENGSTLDGFEIELDDQPKIFDQFYRVGSEETRASKGTGLGLYIVNKIITKAYKAVVSYFKKKLKPGAFI